jgi:hypothetical protein
VEGSAVARTAHQVSLFVWLRGMPSLILAEDNSTAFNLGGRGGGHTGQKHPDFLSIVPVPVPFTVYMPPHPLSNFLK